MHTEQTIFNSPEFHLIAILCSKFDFAQTSELSRAYVNNAVSKLEQSVGRARCAPQEDR